MKRTNLQYKAAPTFNSACKRLFLPYYSYSLPRWINRRAESVADLLSSTLAVPFIISIRIHKGGSVGAEACNASYWLPISHSLCSDWCRFVLLPELAHSKPFLNKVVPFYEVNPKCFNVLLQSVFPAPNWAHDTYCIRFLEQCARYK